MNGLLGGDGGESGVATTETSVPEPEIFRCRSSYEQEEIAASMVCDSVKDCDDGSDEELCGKFGWLSVGNLEIG